MFRAGRTSWILVALVALVLAIVGVVLLGGESPTSSAQKFLAALSLRDPKTLADLSYFNPPLPRDEVVKKWEKTLSVSQHYCFAWRFAGETRHTPDTSSVNMFFVKDADKSMAYEEKFSLGMVRQDGRWKVDVRSISRAMYPGLPR